VGTGSGAIAVALAANIPNCQIWATDISSQALAVASENARRYGLEDRIVPVRGNLLDGVPDKLDMIVANLPYISAREVPMLVDEISKHEPVNALCGGDTGTEIIEELIGSSAKCIGQGGALLLEIGIGQESRIVACARLSFRGSSISLTKDLSGIYRVVKIETERSAR
jgi:release factor glutamine methyltransferase